MNRTFGPRRAVWIDLTNDDAPAGHGRAVTTSAGTGDGHGEV